MRISRRRTAKNPNLSPSTLRGSRGPEGLTGKILPHNRSATRSAAARFGALPAQISRTADIVCNECEAVVRTVPTGDVQRTLGREAGEAGRGERAMPLLRERESLRGFSEILAYVWQEWRDGVTIVRR